jgi:hypothetical protein
MENVEHGSSWIDSGCGRGVPVGQGQHSPARGSSASSSGRNGRWGGSNSIGHHLFPRVALNKAYAYEENGAF